MELKKAQSKIGRPKVTLKRREHLAVMCTILERKTIENKAKTAHLTISEFLRELGLKGKVKTRRSLPGQVLALTGTLNHMAANLNQIARRRNRGEFLNIVERTALNRQSNELQEISHIIKSFLS